jgi:hypothetical protein
MVTFNFYTDPGHGWLEVPKHLLVELRIQWDISSHSYMKDHLAYLEEDLDASIFSRAYESKHGVRPSIDEVYQEVTPIRNYERYQSGSEGGDETAHIRASTA